MVELYKRKVPLPAAAPPTKKKIGAKSTTSKAAEAKDTATEKAEEATTKAEEVARTAVNGAKKVSSPPGVGGTIDLDGFGGGIDRNDNTKVTLKKLVEERKADVVLFTYPKASTPGCKLLHPAYYTT